MGEVSPVVEAGERRPEGPSLSHPEGLVTREIPSSTSREAAQLGTSAEEVIVLLEGQDLMPQHRARLEKPVGETAYEAGLPSVSDRAQAWCAWEIFAAPETQGVDPPVGMMEQADMAIGTAVTRLGPNILTLPQRYVNSDGEPYYMIGVSKVVEDRATKELPNWCPDVLRLPDPSDLSEGPSFEMDDPAEVLRWSHTEEYQVWMEHSVKTMVTCFSKDLVQQFMVSGFFLGVKYSWTG